MKKPTDQQQYEQQVKKEVQKGLSLPVTGCLYVIILCAVASMAVKGCKMVNMKYEEQKVKHEMYIDSINKVRQDTTYYYRGKQK